MVPNIKGYFQSFTNCIVWDVDKGFLTAIDPELIKPYSVGLQKFRRRFWVRFRTQTYYGAETEWFEEAEVGRIGKARPKNAVIDHREVERRHENLLAVTVVVQRRRNVGGEGRDAVGVVEFHGFGAKIVNSERRYWCYVERFTGSPVSRICLVIIMNMNMNINKKHDEVSLEYREKKEKKEKR